VTPPRPQPPPLPNPVSPLPPPKVNLRVFLFLAGDGGADFVVVLGLFLFFSLKPYRLQICRVCPLRRQRQTGLKEPAPSPFFFFRRHTIGLSLPFCETLSVSRLLLVHKRVMTFFFRRLLSVPPFFQSYFFFADDTEATVDAPSH